MPLAIENLTRSYRANVAVRDLSARVDDGSIIAVLGANGAGKSTLLQLLAGWMPPSLGRIQIDGFTLRASSRSVRRSAEREVGLRRVDT